MIEEQINVEEFKEEEVKVEWTGSEDLGVGDTEAVEESVLDIEQDEENKDSAIEQEFKEEVVDSIITEELSLKEKYPTLKPAFYKRDFPNQLKAVIKAKEKGNEAKYKDFIKAVQVGDIKRDLLSNLSKKDLLQIIEWGLV